jgi:hypothetical protein
MRYKVGAEQLEQVLSLAHRPDGTFRSARTAPIGPTHAVDATTGAVACGIKGHKLEASAVHRRFQELFRTKARRRAAGGQQRDEGPPCEPTPHHPSFVSRCRAPAVVNGSLLAS